MKSPLSAAFPLSILLAVMMTAGPSAATPTNNDFSSGLDSWTTGGDVTANDDAARLGDQGTFYSALYQGDPLAGGRTTFSFDFRSELSSTVPGGPFGFADTFFSTLYLTDDLSAFDLSPGSYGDAIALFDYDHVGAFNLTGSIGASSNRTGWLSYELEFDSVFAYAIPTFELFEQNFVDGDSAFWIDNVSLEAARDAENPVPEPSAVLLFGVGFLVLARRVSIVRDFAA